MRSTREGEKYRTQRIAKEGRSLTHHRKQGQTQTTPPTTELQESRRTTTRPDERRPLKARGKGQGKGRLRPLLTQAVRDPFHPRLRLPDQRGAFASAPLLDEPLEEAVEGGGVVAVGDADALGPDARLRARLPVEVVPVHLLALAAVTGGDENTRT